MSLEKLKSAFSKIKGFGNDSDLAKTTPNIPRSFGDDLGLDDFNEERRPKSAGGDINKNIQNQVNFTTQVPNPFQPRGFGDDLGLDDYSPNRIPPTPPKTTPDIPRSFGDDLGLDDFDPNRIPPSGKIKIGNSTRGFGDDLGLDDFSPNRIPPTPPKTTPDIPKGFGDDLGLDDFDDERRPKGTPTPPKTTPNIPKGFGDDLGLDDWDDERRPKGTPTPPKTTPNIPSGFGDDLGLDDWNDERRPKGGLDDTSQNTQNPVTFSTPNIDKDNLSDLINLRSEFSILSEPQIVDNISNIQGVGFTPNRYFNDNISDFTGIDGLEYRNNSLYGEQSVVDFLKNNQGVGFTPNRFLKDISDFTGIEGSEYKNNSLFGGLGIVDFFGGDNSYYSTVNPLISGFDVNFNKGGYSFARGQVGNSKYIDIVTGTHTRSNSFSNLINYKNQSTIGNDLISSDIVGFTSKFGPTGNTFGDGDVGNSNFIGVSSTKNVLDSVNFLNDNDALGFTLSNVDTPFTSQFVGLDEMALTFTKQPSLLSYDTHDVNLNSIVAISLLSQKTDGVDFLKGRNSYYGDVNNSDGIPGFTIDFTAAGYTSGDGEFGDSKFLKDDGTMISTGTHTMYGKSLTLNDQENIGLSFINKSSIFGDDPSSTDVVETDFTIPFAKGFTSKLKTIDYLNSQFEGINEENNTYDPKTTYHGGYNINTDNIDTKVSVPDDGQLFNPAEDVGQFGTSNIGLGLFPSKTITLQNGNAIEFTSFAVDGDQSFQFKTLYRDDQNVTENKFTNGVDMSLQNDGSGAHPSQGPGGLLFGLPRGNEPYIISQNGKTGYGDRIMPLNAVVDDTIRLASFVSSEQGIAFVTKENALGLGGFISQLENIAGNKYGNKLYDPSSLSSGLPVGPVNFRQRRDSGPIAFLADLFLDIPSQGENYPGSDGQYLEQTDKKYNNRNLPIFGVMGDGTTLDTSPSPESKQTMQKSMSPFKFDNLSLGDVQYNNILLQDHIRNTDNVSSISDVGFDQITLMDTNTTLTNGSAVTPENVVTFTKKQLEEADKEKHGMPLYFRDLRDGSALIFRAFINGLNESFSPSWNSENYIGRSEPVYIFTGGTEREIGFQLKLVAQNAIELTAIYEKLNKLTSLVYPEYLDLNISPKFFDSNGTSFVADPGTIAGKVRMKAPLTKFRMGELYGSSVGPNKEVTGFIKSLSYTFPDEGVWETRKGYRVPKYIDIDLTYQVIHDEVPSLAFAKVAESGEQQSFYGINQYGAPFKAVTS